MYFQCTVYYKTYHYIFFLYNESRMNDNRNKDTDFWTCLVNTYILITYTFYNFPVWLHQDYTNAAVRIRTIQVLLTCTFYIFLTIISDSCKEPLIYVELHSQFHLPFKKLMWHYHNVAQLPDLNLKKAHILDITVLLLCPLKKNKKAKTCIY